MFITALMLLMVSAMPMDNSPFSSSTSTSSLSSLSMSPPTTPPSSPRPSLRKSNSDYFLDSGMQTPDTSDALLGDLVMDNELLKDMQLEDTAPLSRHKALTPAEWNAFFKEIQQDEEANLAKANPQLEEFFQTSPESQLE